MINIVKHLEEWLSQERTIQELKAKAKELGLAVKKQMTKNDVRKLIERYVERVKTVQPEEPSQSKPSSSTSSSGQPSLTSQPVREDISIPENYNKDKLVAMPVNPFWIHVYWDLSPANREFLRSHEVRKVVLRVYDVTFIEFDGTNAHRTFEVNIDVSSLKNYYMNVPMPGAHYLAELGYYDSNGNYKHLFRSNLCRVPVNSPSQSTRERWLDLRKRRRIVMPSEGMLTPIVERIGGSIQGLEHLFRISSAGSISVIRLSGKGM
ncbi:DUF4912 domain-containing protein [Fervidobacterium islandicum]|uniref:DUF4912 domain-containing protein n=1 Tax=Fervidobacterium islandicum TaxID=2423 RepID=UPI003A6063DE